MTSLVLLYGLVIGSFLNVCIYRIPKDESIVFPYSYCRSCNKRISWYDNIPVLSYVILKGKCRSCNEKISIEYPIVEVSNAIIYLALLNHYGLSIDLLFHTSIMSVLIIVFFIDLKEMIIPDELILIIIILEVLYKINLIFQGRQIYLKSSIVGAILSGVIFLIIVILSKGGMGGGDITLITALGFILGSKLIALNIFLSFLIGAIISIFLLLFKIKTIKDPIPFGPFIITSFLIVSLFGEQIIQIYIELII